MRLTNSIRDSIIAGVIKHRFEKEEAALSALKDELDRVSRLNGRKIYDACYSKQQRGILEHAPDSFFKHRRDGIRLKVDEGGLFETTFGKPMPVPYAHESSYTVLAVVPTSVRDLAGEIDGAREAVDDAKSELRTAKRSAENDLRAALKNFSTVKRVRDEWPELAAFLPKAEPASVPAVRIDELNKTLGLPPE